MLNHAVLIIGRLGGWISLHVVMLDLSTCFVNFPKYIHNLSGLWLNFLSSFLSLLMLDFISDLWWNVLRDRFHDFSFLPNKGLRYCLVGYFNFSWLLLFVPLP